jgi:hypothetical protein
MKKSLGFSGYLILIISGVYLDAPFIALLAIPLFLIGFILLLWFYLGFITNQKTKKMLSVFMIFIGMVMLCGGLGFSAIGYNQFQVDVSRNIVNESELNWSNILVIVAINLIASLLIYFGIQKSKNLSKTNLLFVWLPTLFIIPFTLFLIKLATVTGFWFGG